MEKYIDNRYDFVFLFDVKDGNPNGDPDMDNQPRVDIETNEGLVTDVCIKRKVRNYVQLKHELNAPYDIFIRQGNILNDLIEKKKKEEKGDKAKSVLAMCDTYYDIRTFGAVMTTGGKEGIGTVRGPVQFGFARTIDPIDIKPHTLTRCCVTKKDDESKDSTFGNKTTVSYGLYRMHGYISAFDAQKFHFTENDLQLLWEALLNSFEHDHAAARGDMAPRALIVFKHASKLGNARSCDLFDRVHVSKKEGIEYPRSHNDYTLQIEETSTDSGVETIVMLKW